MKTTMKPISFLFQICAMGNRPRNRSPRLRSGVATRHRAHLWGILVAGVVFLVAMPAMADGWAVGTGGLIMKSTDGGGTWSSINPNGSILNSVFFLNDATGWAVGTGGVVMKTINGGTTWSQTFPTAAALNDVFFLDANRGWAVGNTGTTMRTTNGGTNWIISTPTASTLDAVFFIDQNTGWVVGGGGVVLKSVDGGANWSQTNPTGAALRDVFFISSSTGWAAGSAGTVIKTTNGGTNWTTSTPTSGTLNAVRFISSTVGWAVGGTGTILKTADGGTNWALQQPVAQDLNSVFFINANTGWSVGSGGVVLKTENAGGSWAPTYPTGAVLNDVFFASIPTPISVTVQTAPSGRSFVVDGTTFTTTQTFSWFAGQPHTIGTTSPQAGASGTQYVWTSWSDGGAISHTITPGASTTYTANFQTQYQLTMQAGTGGTVSPSSGFRAAASVVSISATPNAGHVFTGWTGIGSGSYSGSANPVSVTMNGPITETAQFAATVSVTVRTSPSGRAFTVDGTSYTTQQTFTWLSGASHTIATSSPQAGGSGVRYVWASWSNGGSQSQVVAPTSNTTYTANFTTQYELTMTATTGGTTNPSTGWRDAGTAVAITATPTLGNDFTSWTGSGAGSYSGTNNPASVTMNGPISELATFSHNNMLEVPGEFATITAALTQAIAGDTVRIACGTYNEHDLLVPNGVVITSSTGQPECVTVDPGEQGMRVFHMDGGPSTMLKGITVANARAPGGAAIFGSGSPTVLNCAFDNNRVLGSAAGGAVDLSGAPHFEECTFDNNAASSGGAVNCFGGTFINCIFTNNLASELDGGAINGEVALIDGCEFKNNYAFLNGGAVYACADTVRNSLFVSNGLASHFGTGGAANFQCAPVVSNCTFYSNGIDSDAPNIRGAAIAFASSGTAVMTHTIVANSYVFGDVPDAGSVACLGIAGVQVLCCNIDGTTGTGDWVGCLAAQYGVNGNISGDPLFCDAASGDFSLANTSPSNTAACGRQGAYGVGCTSTAVDDIAPVTRVQLHQNVPNPFNPATMIQFDVPRAAGVRLNIYNVSGRLVRSLLDRTVGEGTHETRWDGTNDRGELVGSGVYFYRLEVGAASLTKKMVLLK